MPSLNSNCVVAVITDLLRYESGKPVRETSDFGGVFYNVGSSISHLKYKFDSTTLHCTNLFQYIYDSQSGLHACYVLLLNKLFHSHYHPSRCCILSAMANKTLTLQM